MCVWVLFVISTAFLAFPLFSFILYPLLRAVGITVHSTFYSPLPPPPPSPVQLPDALTHHQQKTVSFTFTFIACHFERAFERTNAKIFFVFLLKGHTHSFRFRKGVKWQTKRRKKRKLGKAVKNVTHTQKWGQEKLVRLEVSNRQKEKEKKQSSHCSLYSFQAEGIFHSRQSM